LPENFDLDTLDTASVNSSPETGAFYSSRHGRKFVCQTWSQNGESWTFKISMLLNKWRGKTSPICVSKEVPQWYSSSFHVVLEE